MMRGANKVEWVMGEDTMCEFCSDKKAKWVVHYIGSKENKDDHMAICDDDKCIKKMESQDYFPCGCGG